MLKFTGLAALAAVLMVAAGQPASARFFDPALQAAPSAAEAVACRTVRERIVRPDGRVIHRSKRICDRSDRRDRGARLGIGGVEVRIGRDRDCRTIRERVVRPNGSVVYRSVRRCR